MKRVRRGKGHPRESGFIVTRDVEGVDRAAAHRVQYYMLGTTVTANGRVYRYPGFVERDGVRYLGQSVVFVRPNLLAEIESFLAGRSVDHEATRAILE